MMEISLVSPGRIDRMWSVLSELLEPAVSHDPNGMRMDDLRSRLMDGRFHLAEGYDEKTYGLLAYHMFEEGGDLCCFASYLAGKFTGPKGFVHTIRELMTAFETASRNAGVNAVYIGGRDWSRIFPDYELTGDEPNQRRKRL